MTTARRPTPTGAELAAGLTMGVGANLTWGLAFLVPVLLAAFNPVVITLGRYLAYGALSVAIVVLAGKHVRSLDRQAWLAAGLFAFTGNIGYYFLLVQGIALVGAPPVVVIIGTLPVTVSLYGNWRRREFPFRRLALPLVLIGVGLVVVNSVEIDWSGVTGRPLGAQIAGVACAVGALALWTWYGVANASFLKSRPDVTAGQWSTAVGLMTLGLAVLASPALLLGVSARVPPAGTGLGDELWLLVAGSLLLGVAVSWGGTLLWNGASHRLPVSMVGQLIVFETISGLVYVYLALWRVPPLVTVAGIAAVMSGVLLGIRRSMHAEPRPEPAPGGAGAPLDRAP